MAGPSFDRRVCLAACYLREILLDVLQAAARESPEKALPILQLLGEVNQLIEDMGGPAHDKERPAA